MNRSDGVAARWDMTLRLSVLVSLGLGLLGCATSIAFQPDDAGPLDGGPPPAPDDGPLPEDPLERSFATWVSAESVFNDEVCRCPDAPALCGPSYVADRERFFDCAELFANGSRTLKQDLVEMLDCYSARHEEVARCVEAAGGGCPGELAFEACLEAHFCAYARCEAAASSSAQGVANICGERAAEDLGRPGYLPPGVSCD